MAKDNNIASPRVLPDVAAMQARIAQLEAEKAALEASRGKGGFSCLEVDKPSKDGKKTYHGLEVTGNFFPPLFLTDAKVEALIQFLPKVREYAEKRLKKA